MAPNPALLLGSPNALHPNGIGNRSGQVGRYLMTHPAVAAFGLFDDVDTEPHRGVTGAQLIGHDNYRKDAEAGSVGGYQWLVAPSIKPNDLAGIALARGDRRGHVEISQHQQVIAVGPGELGIDEVRDPGGPSPDDQSFRKTLECCQLAA